MEVLFFSQFDILRPTTNKLSAVRFCEGLCENGVRVRHVGPYIFRRSNIRRAQIDAYYGLERSFPKTILWTPLIEVSPPWLAQSTMALAATAAFLWFYIRRSERRSPLIVLSTAPNILWTLMWVAQSLRFSDVRFVFWAHEARFRHRISAQVIRRADLVCATNSAILEDLHSHLGFDRARGFVTLNPISARQTAQPVMPRAVARTKLGLVLDKPLVVYTGKVGHGVQEVAYILEAAALLPGFQFLLTGGKPEVIRQFAARCRERHVSNVCFAGFIDDYTRITCYQAAADILVSYYSRYDHLVDHNYPQKLTEYMLTDNPIISPNYRATRDILNETNCFFVDPDNPPALAAAIEAVYRNPEGARQRAHQARIDVLGVTFRAVTERLRQRLERV